VSYISALRSMELFNLSVKFLIHHSQLFSIFQVDFVSVGSR